MHILSREIWSFTWSLTLSPGPTVCKMVGLKSKQSVASDLDWPLPKNTVLPWSPAAGHLIGCLSTRHWVLLIRGEKHAGSFICHKWPHNWLLLTACWFHLMFRVGWTSPCACVSWKPIDRQRTHLWLCLCCTGAVHLWRRSCATESACGHKIGAVRPQRCPHVLVKGQCDLNTATCLDHTDPPLLSKGIMHSLTQFFGYADPSVSTHSCVCGCCHWAAMYEICGSY